MGVRATGWVEALRVSVEALGGRRSLRPRLQGGAFLANRETELAAGSLRHSQAKEGKEGKEGKQGRSQYGDDDSDDEEAGAGAGQMVNPMYSGAQEPQGARRTAWPASPAPASAAPPAPSGRNARKKERSSEESGYLEKQSGGLFITSWKRPVAPHADRALPSLLLLSLAAGLPTVGDLPELNRSGFSADPLTRAVCRASKCQFYPFAQAVGGAEVAGDVDVLQGARRPKAPQARREPAASNGAALGERLHCETAARLQTHHPHWRRICLLGRDRDAGAGESRALTCCDGCGVVACIAHASCSATGPRRRRRRRRPLRSSPCDPLLCRIGSTASCASSRRREDASFVPRLVLVASIPGLSCTRASVQIALATPPPPFTACRPAPQSPA